MENERPYLNENLSRLQTPRMPQTHGFPMNSMDSPASREESCGRGRAPFGKRPGGTRTSAVDRNMFENWLTRLSNWSQQTDVPEANQAFWGKPTGARTSTTGEKVESAFYAYKERNGGVNCWECGKPGQTSARRTGARCQASHQQFSLHRRHHLHGTQDVRGAMCDDLRQDKLMPLANKTINGKNSNSRRTMRRTNLERKLTTTTWMRNSRIRIPKHQHKSQLPRVGWKRHSVQLSK